MIEFQISSGEFTIIETMNSVEEMKKILLKGLRGKLGFPGIIDTTTPLMDRMFDIVIQNFVKDFNKKTVYELEYKGSSENAIFFDEITTNTKDLSIEIN